MGDVTSDTDESFAEALTRIVRGRWDEIESSMIEFGTPLAVPGTSATVRCHFLRSDPNGAARVDALARQLADQVVHYCVPRSEIAKAQTLPPDQMITAITRMSREAAKLFTRNQLKTGEAAELLLYALLEKRLRIPQVLSKMSLKTSTEMQYQGADGVHARLLENGDLALYWGEAKLYESVGEAMSDCLDSLLPYLKGSGWEQDVYLIRHFADTGIEPLTLRLLEFFDDGLPQSARVEMRGACLIGFTHASYPRLPHELEDLRGQIEGTLQGWSDGMKTRIRNRELDSFVIEVFLVPVPGAQAFRDAVKRELGLPIVTS